MILYVEWWINTIYRNLPFRSEFPCRLIGQDTPVSRPCQIPHDILSIRPFVVFSSRFWPIFPVNKITKLHFSHLQGLINENLPAQLTIVAALYPISNFDPQGHHERSHTVYIRYKLMVSRSVLFARPEVCNVPTYCHAFLNAARTWSRSFLGNVKKHSMLIPGHFSIRMYVMYPPGTYLSLSWTVCFQAKREGVEEHLASVRACRASISSSALKSIFGRACFDLMFRGFDIVP